MMTGYYSAYKAATEKVIRQSINDRGCQPILFVGSGLSKRYFGAPNWTELLGYLAQACPQIDRDVAYYQQRHQSLEEIGSHFAAAYQEWAWSTAGRKEFPAELFDAAQAGDIYLKHKVADHFTKITPRNLAKLKPAVRQEVEGLQQIQPHAIITTNYDPFLEVAFPNYASVIGQQLLRANYVSIGEIFKIHGCASNPQSIVLTKEDYAEWSRKKKYLSAKLLTYFAEHPMLFIGYSASDANIRAILSDIDEILAEPDGLVRNLFFLHYAPGAEEEDDLPEERLISLSEGRSIRVRNIDASDYRWVFEAFGSGTPVEQVNPKLLRALLARNYELVRHDIPRKTVEVNFATLEHAVKNEGNLAQLLGIATLDDPGVFNANYPYTLTGVAQQLGFTYWSHANQLIKRVETDSGIDIKSFDNRYHVKVKVGNSDDSVTNKYSQACVDLLEAVKSGKPYAVDTSVRSGPKQSVDAA